jgi:hypothetical protein
MAEDHDSTQDKAARRAAWAKCLKPGGHLLIDQTAGRLPKPSTMLDPFGATREAVIKILTDTLVDPGQVSDVLVRTCDADDPSTVIVLTWG